MLTKTKKIGFHKILALNVKLLLQLWSQFILFQRHFMKNVPSYYQTCYVKYIYMPNYVKKFSSHSDVFM